MLTEFSGGRFDRIWRISLQRNRIVLMATTLPHLGMRDGGMVCMHIMDPTRQSNES